jgi:hypothetical protein
LCQVNPTPITHGKSQKKHCPAGQWGKWIPVKTMPKIRCRGKLAFGIKKRRQKGQNPLLSPFA